MSENESRLIFQSGNVFDSQSGTIKENCTIVIAENKFAWIGDESSYVKEANDEIINGTGKTILPGLIDCHLHLAGNAAIEYEREYLRTKEGDYHYYALKNAQKQLISGITCVRDCWGDSEWGPSLRRMLDRGMFAGPRLLVANQGITQWGDQEGIGPEWSLKEQRELSEIPTGIDGMKHAVRERKFSGSDFIKIATTGGILHGIESALQRSLFLEEEVAAITEEAHRLGMHVACHAYGADGIRKAVEGGVDTLEHGIFIDEEIAELMVRKGTYLIPTQIAMRTPPEILKKFPPEVIKKEREVSQHMVGNHRLAFEKGVPIAVGTDCGAPVIPHGSTGTEIKYMVENIGMTPSQALQAATIHGAKAIKMDNRIGTIEQGKYADLVICEKNPLEDISLLENAKNYTHIIKDGKIMVERGKIIYFG